MSRSHWGHFYSLKLNWTYLFLIILFFLHVQTCCWSDSSGCCLVVPHSLARSVIVLCPVILLMALLAADILLIDPRLPLSLFPSHEKRFQLSDWILFLPDLVHSERAPSIFGLTRRLFIRPTHGRGSNDFYESDGGAVEKRHTSRILFQRARSKWEVWLKSRTQIIVFKCLFSLKGLKVTRRVGIKGGRLHFYFIFIFLMF